MLSGKVPVKPEGGSQCKLQLELVEGDLLVSLI